MTIKGVNQTQTTNIFLVDNKAPQDETDFGKGKRTESKQESEVKRRTQEESRN